MIIEILLSIQTAMAADNACLQGDPKNQVFVQQLKKAKDPLSAKFRALGAESKTATESDYCLKCELAPANGDLQAVVKQSQDLVRTSRPHIREECIHASLKRTIEFGGRLCDGSAARKNSPPCVTPEVADYVSYAVNEAMACVASYTDLEPRWMLRKLNADSGFQFWTANDDRVGIGRLSPGRRRDIGGWTGVRANGSRVTVPARSQALAKLAASKEPSCEAFQKILAKEKPAAADGKGDECAFQSLGEGLARNLIYTLNSFADLRDEDVVPELAHYNAELSKDRELVNQLAIVADSDFGMAGVASFLNSQRIKPTTTAQDVLKKLADHPALQDNLKSHRDMMKKLVPDRENLSDPEKDGSTCVGY